jgi:hypothetical protein
MPAGFERHLAELRTIRADGSGPNELVAITDQLLIKSERSFDAELMRTASEARMALQTRRLRRGVSGMPAGLSA